METPKLSRKSLYLFVYSVPTKNSNINRPEFKHIAYLWSAAVQVYGDTDEVFERQICASYLKSKGVAIEPCDIFREYCHHESTMFLTCFRPHRYAVIILESNKPSNVYYLNCSNTVPKLYAVSCSNSRDTFANGRYFIVSDKQLSVISNSAGESSHDAKMVKLVADQFVIDNSKYGLNLLMHEVFIHCISLVFITTTQA